MEREGLRLGEAGGEQREQREMLSRVAGRCLGGGGSPHDERGFIGAPGGGHAWSELRHCGPSVWFHMFITRAGLDLGM